jgi:hypothetical protein
VNSGVHVGWSMCVYDWVILLVKIHLEDFALKFLFIFNAHFFFFPANIPYPIFAVFGSCFGSFDHWFVFAIFLAHWHAIQLS